MRRALDRAVIAVLVLASPAPAALIAPAAAQPGPAVASTIESGERLVFFTTAARLSVDGRVWSLPIHGRVYRPVNSAARKGLIAQLLQTAYGVVPDRESRTRFDERIDLLLGDNKGGRRVVVRIGSQTQAMPPSAADGHFTGTVEVPAAELAREARDGRVAISAALAPRDPRTFTGTVLLVGPRGRSVISDIDDTVKVTNVLDRRRMLEATFVKPYEAVPGLARLYQTWAAEGTAFHFVSSSPWLLYEPLAAFLEEAGFPPASIGLKQIRLKDSSIQNLFADATQTKPPQIEALLKAYPERTFILVGDSGEKDPEIYADFLRRYPGRIESVFIRSVTEAKATEARLAKLFAGLDRARWQLFTDARELPMMLRP